MEAVLERPITQSIASRVISYKLQPELKYKRYDIWMAEMREGKGAEQVGSRPCLIIQNDLGNKYSPTVIVAPLTASSTKAKLPTHVYIQASETGLEKDSIILLEQPLTLDKTRLKYKICSLGRYSRFNVDKALAISVGLSSVN